MRSLHKPIVLGVAALIAAAGCPSAQAFMYMGGDEVYEQLGLNDSNSDQNQNQNQNQNRTSSAQRAPQNYSGPSVESTSAPMQQTAQSGGNAGNGGNGGNKPEWLGYWVGNLQYRVVQVGDALYKVSPDGKATPLPVGTVAESVAVPFDNAFVKGMMSSQPVAGPETQARINHQKNGGDARFISNAGLLTPTFMATRTMVVNNEPMVVGGPVICEWKAQTQNVIASAPMTRQTKTQARVITKSKVTKRKLRKRNSH